MPKILPALVVATAVAGLGVARAQQQTGPPPDLPTAASPVSQLGPGLFKIGEIKVDTTKHEASVAAKVNTIMGSAPLEFVANTRGGMKAYESALTIDTSAVTFNAAMLLLGLDPAHARVPTRHFDPVPPQGDRVAMWIDWSRGGEQVRTPVEQLLFDNQSRQAVSASDWVYTGSVFLPETTRGTHYMADIDGVLIGFVHSPAPIIEMVAGPGVGRYGNIVMNPNLGLAPETQVMLTVKVLAPAPKPR